MTKVFVEQPLALPRSAEYLSNATFGTILAYQMSVLERLEKEKNAKFSMLDLHQVFCSIYIYIFFVEIFAYFWFLEFFIDICIGIFFTPLPSLKKVRYLYDPPLKKQNYI